MKKQKLSITEGLIIQIVLPGTLQKKVVQIGHSPGHLGKTKTYMNRYVEREILVPADE